MTCHKPPKWRGESLEWFCREWIAILRGDFPSSSNNFSLSPESMTIYFWCIEVLKDPFQIQVSGCRKTCVHKSCGRMFYACVRRKKCALAGNNSKGKVVELMGTLKAARFANGNRVDSVCDAWGGKTLAILPKVWLERRRLFVWGLLITFTCGISVQCATWNISNDDISISRLTEVSSIMRLTRANVSSQQLYQLILDTPNQFHQTNWYSERDMQHDTLSTVEPIGGGPKMDALPKIDGGPKIDGLPKIDGGPRIDGGPKIDGGSRIDGGPKIDSRAKSSVRRSLLLNDLSGDPNTYWCIGWIIWVGLEELWLRGRT